MHHAHIQPTTQCVKIVTCVVVEGLVSLVPAPLSVTISLCSICPPPFFSHSLLTHLPFLPLSTPAPQIFLGNSHTEIQTPSRLPRSPPPRNFQAPRAPPPLRPLPPLHPTKQPPLRCPGQPGRRNLPSLLPAQNTDHSPILCPPPQARPKPHQVDLPHHPHRGGLAYRAGCTCSE